MKSLFCSNLSNKFTALGIAVAVSAGFGGILTVDEAQAEATFSLYGGHNSSPHSRVEYDLNLGAGPQNVTVGFDGKSFEMPPYYGVRGTWWLESKPQFGVGYRFFPYQSLRKSSTSRAECFGIY